MYRPAATPTKTKKTRVGHSDWPSPVGIAHAKAAVSNIIMTAPMETNTNSMRSPESIPALPDERLVGCGRRHPSDEPRCERSDNGQHHQNDADPPLAPGNRVPVRAHGLPKAVAEPAECGSQDVRRETRPFQQSVAARKH